MNENNQKLVLELYNKGLNDIQISKKLNLNRGTVKYYRTKMGLESKFKRGYKKIDRNLIKKYVNKDYSDKKIADILKVSIHTIGLIRFRELGIKKREFRPPYKNKEIQQHHILPKIFKSKFDEDIYCLLKNETIPVSLKYHRELHKQFKTNFIKYIKTIETLSDNYVKCILSFTYITNEKLKCTEEFKNAIEMITIVMMIDRKEFNKIKDLYKEKMKGVTDQCKNYGGLNLKPLMRLIRVKMNERYTIEEIIKNEIPDEFGQSIKSELLQDGTYSEILGKGL